jgi:phospholipid-binding lipoprotein MlaA
MTRSTTTLLALLFLAGCASTAAPPPDERHPRDPWEPYNRNVYAFNQAVDEAVIRPLAVGYDRVTPEFAQAGVRNFFTNVRAPIDLVNLMLQGRPGHAGEEFSRFFLNTVFGIGGLFDIATPVGLEQYEEDFGQTFAVWGWEDSRYFVLPFLGPSTVRDGLGRVPGVYSDVAWMWILEETSYAWLALEIINRRHALLPYDADIAAAYDPYTFVRDGWLQQRDYEITEGEGDLPDYEAYLDEGNEDSQVP